MFLHIDNFVYEGGYRLRVTFNDGVTKEVDLYEELSGPVFEPLKDVPFFRKVRLNQDTGTIEWPNGADFAPEFLFEIGTTVSTTMTKKVAQDQAKYGS